MSMLLNIVITLGSVRTGRMVERVAKLVTKQIESKGVKPIIMDPLEICQYELNKQPLHYLSSSEELPTWMKKTHQIILNADGFLMLATEYNCGLPPALLNLLNSFPPVSFRHKPCGIITYSMGPFGAVRSDTLLRPYLNQLGLVTLPCGGPIPTVHSLIDEAGNTSNEMVSQRIEKVVQEVLWYAEALKMFKESKPPPT